MDGEIINWDEHQLNQILHTDFLAQNDLKRVTRKDASHFMAQFS